jgi:hypothetical protein
MKPSEIPTTDSAMKAAGMNRAARLAALSVLRRGGSKKDAMVAALKKVRR